eukprot:Blabericola_migrator_1__682@NODE_116_length_13817_cov_119_091491_g104_i0_p16_GENE_NODE_116_length_13817_cov_119_091491_g104_i0NODE_116_length_13817_cov_119_091491_g104_i0_p16_ORF_typecomplete_len123_score14_83Herpes_gE/PF02480_16/0_00024PBP1_TM/PF14812_6/5_2e03PBP1_TM/PF14812_6/0_32_NODE_116_length_13817_cov_119_091491_g104_i061036471
MTTSWGGVGGQDQSQDEAEAGSDYDSNVVNMALVSGCMGALLLAGFGWLACQCRWFGYSSDQQRKSFHSRRFSQYSNYDDEFLSDDSSTDSEGTAKSSEFDGTAPPKRRRRSVVDFFGCDAL